MNCPKITSCKKRLFFLPVVLVFILISGEAVSQFVKPKLIIGIVVEQMRWDHFSRMTDINVSKGFKKLASDGYEMANVHLNYFPSTAASGYASIFSGTVPSIHGIVSNLWFNKYSGRVQYCVEDQFVMAVGSRPFPAASPKNLLVTTFGDELRINSNFRSKVISLSLNDRGAVLSGGHTANAAYWYDGRNGSFVSSTHYMNDLPGWMVQFNSRKKVDSLYSLNWGPYLSRDFYIPYKIPGEECNTSNSRNCFLDSVYELKQFVQKDYQKLVQTPHGNTLVFELARHAIQSETLGKDAFPDLLTINLSSTDYIGHKFGPHSLEVLDTYYRLDENIDDLIQFLNKYLGKDNYLLFVTSVHGVAHSPSFLSANKLPGGFVDLGKRITALDRELKDSLGDFNWINSFSNPFISLNDSSIQKSGFSKTIVKQKIKAALEEELGVYKILDVESIARENLEENFQSKIINGHYSERTGDLLVLYRPQWMSGSYVTGGANHGSAFPYDTHVPLLFYGAGIRKGIDYEKYYVSDIAATICAILKIQEPSGSIGNLMTSLLNSIYKNGGF